MLQSQQEDKPTTSGNEARQTMSTHIQIFQLSRQLLSRLQFVFVLEAQVQLQMALEEIYQDL